MASRFLKDDMLNGNKIRLGERIYSCIAARKHVSFYAEKRW